jgi:hypothetical protein
MARVDVKEIGAKRSLDVVGQAEAEHVHIKGHDRFYVCDSQHDMTEAERPGAKARDRTARAERRIVDFGAMERLQPVPGRITKRDQRANSSRIGQRPRLRRYSNLRAFQPGSERVQCRAIGHFPTEEARPVAHCAVDHNALLAVIHTEGKKGIATFDRLKTHHVGAEVPPIVKLVRSESGVTERADHGVSPSNAGVAPADLTQNPTLIFPPVHGIRSLDAAALPWCLRKP